MAGADAERRRRPVVYPRPLRRLLRPVERFLANQSASGIVLIAASLVAFAWANSPWAEAYARLQHVEAGVSAGGWALELSLAHWVNSPLTKSPFADKRTISCRTRLT